MRKPSRPSAVRRPAPARAGLKPAPVHAPRRLQTTADLRRLQRLMTHALVRPLTREGGLQREWIDGRPTAELAAEFIKPNDRLSSFERLEIYNRMYWYRLIECASDDCPGLRALLGEGRFGRLIRAYLAKYPSRSFTLRNLCSRLPGFIREEPRLTSPRTAAAFDVARFEWAQTVAFDGEARPAIEPGELAGAKPGRLRLGLQPYLSLLALDYPVDQYVIAVKRRDALRAEASHAVDGGNGAGRLRHVRAPRRTRVYLAVHRHSGRLYYKRLSPPEFRMLEALKEGLPLGRAIAAGGARVRPERIREWFSLWAKLGWICKKSPSQ
jgi:hypothetical protein